MSPVRPTSRPCTSYAACSHWRRYVPHLPPDLQAGAPPEEERWRWGRLDVHLDRYPSDGPTKLILLHGGGGYGRLLHPIGALCSNDDAEVVAPDLPGYGLTPRPRSGNTWRLWVELVADLVEAERRADGRPVVLFGASMGGPLALHVAGADDRVAGVIATMLLDPRDPASRGALQPPWAPGLMLDALLRLPRPLGGIRVPIRMVSNMRQIANDPELARLCMTDPHGGGSWTSLSFLRSFLTTDPAVPHRDFRACPVLLVHPEDDRWTPVEHSLRVFEQLPVEKRLVMLEGCGHFPVEQPGVGQLRDAVEAFLADVSSVG